VAENSEGNKQGNEKNRRVYKACPHCGQELSPWQQVLLTIDRALVCKNCWYRIILDISEDERIVPAPDIKE
jgi:DNA-directed RNA polymerase subunit RPC12/RpoP